MQIKTTVKYHFTPISVAAIKKTKHKTKKPQKITISAKMGKNQNLCAFSIEM